jgi:hypothetical protein
MSKISEILALCGSTLKVAAVCSFEKLVTLHQNPEDAIDIFTVKTPHLRQIEIFFSSACLMEGGM